ncbi:MAG: hypothetical protein HQL51_12915 [Magnetococcales bacterium]|nr:hypothetical protein [Magnetococcales bacterium]
MSTLGALPAQAKPFTCPEEAWSLRVEIHPIPPVIRTHHDRSITELTALANAKKGESGAKGKRREVYGLMTAVHEQKGSMTFQVISRADSVFQCTYLSDYEARSGFSAIDIFVAREFPVESCFYKALKAHEEEHARLYVEIYKLNLPQLHQTISRVGRSIGLFQSSTPDRGKAVIKERLEKELRRYGDAVRKLADERHGDHDSAVAKEREMAPCGGNAALERFLAGLRSKGEPASRKAVSAASPSAVDQKREAPRPPAPLDWGGPGPPPFPR